MAERRINDAGEKIGGARKDFRRDPLTVKSLDSMTPAEQYEYIQKENIWPIPDWQELIDGGMPVHVAALIKIVRDRVPVRPPKDTELGRHSYIVMLGGVRDRLMACRSVEEVQDVYSLVVDQDLDWRNHRNDPATREMLFSLYKGEKASFYISYKELNKAQAMVAEGWPATKKKAVRKDAGADEAPKPVEPKRPHLAKLQRTGMPDHRQGRDISPEEFLQTFGFRGVEFGEWLPDGERQEVLNRAYDSLHDLAEIMGVPPLAISLDGTLAVAFGARGTGRAAAHYEPGRKVFNLTRLNGAGSLAHEYAHALDNRFGEMLIHDVNRSKARGVTGWDTWQKDLHHHLNKAVGEQADVWHDLIESLRFTALEKAEKLAMKEKQIADCEENIANQLKKIEDYFARTPEDKRPKKFLKDIETWKLQAFRQLEAHKLGHEKLLKMPEYADFGKKTTAFFNNATALNGKSRDYWTQPTEMFARSFESYIFDQLAQRGARSDYLVHSVEEDRFSGPEYKGNPYPSGEERARINAQMERMIEVMRPELEPTPCPTLVF